MIFVFSLLKAISQKENQLIDKEKRQSNGKMERQSKVYSRGKFDLDRMQAKVMEPALQQQSSLIQTNKTDPSTELSRPYLLQALSQMTLKNEQLRLTLQPRKRRRGLSPSLTLTCTNSRNLTTISPKNISSNSSMSTTGQIKRR